MSQATQTQAQTRRGARGRAAARPRRRRRICCTRGRDALRDAVRSLLEDQAGWRDVLARTESDQTTTPAVAEAGQQVGCAGLLVPEDAGGAGASYREAAVWRGARPVRRRGAVPGQRGRGHGGAAVGRHELLAEVASGAVTAALAVPFATPPGSRPAPTVRLDGPAPGDAAGSYRLSGTVTGIADALTADVLLVPADGVPYGLYAIRADEAGVTAARSHRWT